MTDFARVVPVQIQGQRYPIQTTLELANPSLKPFIRLDQTLVRIHQLVEPQQQPNRCLTIAIQNRLGLGPLHTKPFATRTRVPAPPERLPADAALQALRKTGATGSIPGFPPQGIEVRE